MDNLEHIELAIEQMANDIKDIKRAFPRSSMGEVDYMGHREHHQAVIDAARSQEKFWNELRTDLIKKGAWVVILIVLGLIANGLLFKMGLLK